MRFRRFPALAALALVLVGAAWADRRPVDPPRPSFGGAPPYVMPVAQPPSTLTSTWYCAGAGSKEDGIAEGTVVVANAGDRAVRGTLTAFPAGGEPRARSVEVPARGRATVGLAELGGGAAYTAALVEVPGGDVVAELSVRGEDGTDTTPCSSGASDEWHFPWGVTTIDATERLLLFNPFPGDAIVDVTAATDEGRRDPEALQGLVVPGRTLVPVDVNAEVLRQAHVAISVRARSGRLVVNRVQSLDGSVGRRGLAVTLGAPAAGDEWWFAAGYVAEGTSERLHVYNPTDQEAEVDVLVTLDQPATNGVPAPFELSVGPEDYVTLDLNEEERIPVEVPHATLVQSVNGVPVVAERVVAEFDPSPRSGISAVIGSRATAQEWVFAAGAATDETDELVTLFNPSDERPAAVSVRALDGTPITTVEVPAAGRLGVRLRDFVEAEALPVLVSSTVPIVAERRLAAVDGHGLSSSMGVPLAG